MDIDINPFIQIDLIVIIKRIYIHFWSSIAFKKLSVIVPFVIFKDIICADAATVYGWKKVKHKPKNNDFFRVL